MEFLSAYLPACWDILVESSVYVLLGFFFVGFFKAFVSEAFIRRHLGRSSAGDVVKAALIGAPVPL